MRPMIRLACGLAAGTLLLLTGASVAFAADPLVTIDGSGGTSGDVKAVANAGTSSATDGSATVTIGAGAPTTDGADGSATVTIGAGAPNSVGDPSSSVGALSSGFASLMAFGDTAAEDTTGVAPGAPAMDGAFLGLSQTFGSLLASVGSGGAPSASDGSGGSGGSGSGVAAAGESGAGTLPETSTGTLASGPGTGLPVLALLLGLLAGGLVARRRSVRSAS